MVNGVAVCFPQGHHWESSSFGPSPTSCNDFSQFIPDSDCNTSGTGADQEPVPLTLAEDWTFFKTRLRGFLEMGDCKSTWVSIGWFGATMGYHYFRKPQFWAFDNNKSPGAATWNIWNLTRHSHSRVASRFMLSPSHHWQSYFSVAYCDRFVSLGIFSYHDSMTHASFRRRWRGSCTQWPFQEPKLEVATIYKAYFSGLNFREYPQQIFRPMNHSHQSEAKAFHRWSCVRRGVGEATGPADFLSTDAGEVFGTGGMGAEELSHRSPQKSDGWWLVTMFHRFLTCDSWDDGDIPVQAGCRRQFEEFECMWMSKHGGQNIEQGYVL